MREEKAREIIQQMEAETTRMIQMGMNYKIIQSNLTCELEAMGIDLVTAMEFARKMYVRVNDRINRHKRA